MAQAELDRLWGDPRFWSPIGIYRCPADPRVVVLLGSVLLAAGPTVLAVWSGRMGPIAVVLTTLSSVTLVIALAAWEASRPR